MVVVGVVAVVVTFRPRETHAMRKADIRQKKKKREKNNTKMYK